MSFPSLHVTLSQTWKYISGANCNIRPLACAAFASMEEEHHGVGMFDKVYSLLKKVKGCLLKRYGGH